jgi:NAD(P)-dependent dehydrogenase (short-subunit alcohol dehydrogenase family)
MQLVTHYDFIRKGKKTMADRLKGKVAVITGAARGIGAATAETFAHEGAAVALWDVKDDLGEALCGKINAQGGKAVYCHCDVTKRFEIEAATQRTASTLGTPNVLFNNAAIVVVGSIEELTEEQWDLQYAVNVKSIFLVSACVIPLIRRAGGGSIINVASESAFVGFPMHPAYCSSKAAVVHLSRSMAVRYASEKIRVNALCPGTIRTELYQEFLSLQSDPQAVEQQLIAMHPLGLGNPQDIAWAAVYMASDESGYMTGAPLLMDGGITSI